LQLQGHNRDPIAKQCSGKTGMNGSLHSKHEKLVTTGSVFLTGNSSGRGREKLPEKETEIKPRPGHLQRKCPAHCRKKEEPPDNKHNDRKDQCVKTRLCRIPLHAMTSWLPVYEILYRHHCVQVTLTYKCLRATARLPARGRQSRLTGKRQNEGEKLLWRNHVKNLTLSVAPLRL